MKALLTLLLINLAFVQYSAATEDTNLEADGAMEFTEEDDKDLSLEAPQILPNKSEEEIKTEELSFSSEEPSKPSENIAPASMEASNGMTSTTEPSSDTSNNNSGDATSMDMSDQQSPLEPEANSLSEKSSESVQSTTALASGAEVTVGEVTGVLKYKITCTLNDDVREITSLKKSDGSVSVVYKKFDSLRTIASAPAGSDQADQVAEKIQSNLANNQYPYACSKE